MIRLSDLLGEEYKHSHKRHDPPGSEDADVNNDGKVDNNDKYIMAKRRLYKQYKAAQTSKKPSEFSTPKLENNMIRLSGLINLQALKEQDAPEKEPETKSGEEVPMVQKLTKLKSMELSPEQEKKVDEMLAKLQELTPGQKKLDVDGDGKLEKSDFEKLRAGEKGVEEVTGMYGRSITRRRQFDALMDRKRQVKVKNPETGEEISALTAIRAGNSHPAYNAAKAAYDAVKEEVTEGEDHEVSMGQGLLDDIIKNATELKEKMGQDEKDVPAWIQDHISQAQNFINQANTSFHEHEQPEEAPAPEQAPDAMNEEAPTGWEKTVKAMKKHKEIDNPWALAHWMKKKGYHSQKED